MLESHTDHSAAVTLPTRAGGKRLVDSTWAHGQGMEINKALQCAAASFFSSHHNSKSTVTTEIAIISEAVPLTGRPGEVATTSPWEPVAGSDTTGTVINIPTQRRPTASAAAVKVLGAQRKWRCGGSHNTVR